MSTKYVVIRVEPDLIGAAGINIFDTAEDAHAFLASEWKRVTSQLPEWEGRLAKKTHGCEEVMHVFGNEELYAWMVVKATYPEKFSCQAVVVSYNDYTLKPKVKCFASKESARSCMQENAFDLLRDMTVITYTPMSAVLKDKAERGEAIVEDDRIVIDYGSVFYSWNVFGI